MPSNKSKVRNRAPVPAEHCPAVPQKTCEEPIVASELLLAVAEQNVEAVADCLSRGDDPNATPLKACTPLTLAVKLGNVAMVSSLVQSGAKCTDSGENGMTVLHHAALYGHAEIACYLCRVGGAALDACNQAGCTPLYQAAQHGHADCVTGLLDMRADATIRTRTGATPLYIAADRGNLEIVRILLKSGSDANASTDLQMTPLLVAAFNGHENVIDAFLANNVDIEQRGPCGGTALYVAAQEGRLNVATLLIERGAEIDARCDGQLTPSLIAAMQGHTDLVRLLLSARGDSGVRTDKGSTLAIMAARHGKTDVLKVLVEIGGVQVFDDTNAEGLSPLRASKAGRHKETAAYIESAIIVQKQADLSAWDASLPGILQDLAVPAEQKSKTKSKRKGKVTGKRPREASKSSGMGDSPASQDCDVEALQQDHMPAMDVSMDGVEADAPTNIDQALVIDAGDVLIAQQVECDVGGNGDAVCSQLISEGREHRDIAQDEESTGPWMSVKRKGAGRTARLEETAVAIAPSSVPSRRTAALPEPVKSLVSTPMLSHIPDPLGSAPATPASAQPSTPCTTSSPFGLPAVFPLWPSTPDQFGPEGSPGFWAALPPAVADVVPFFPLLPESYHAASLAVNASVCGPNAVAQSVLTTSLPLENSTDSASKSFDANSFQRLQLD